MHRARRARAAIVIAGGLLSLAALSAATRPDVPDRTPPASVHRSPIALALSGDGSRLLSANQTSDSVSLVDPASGRVLDEIKTGEKPYGVALSADGKRGVVAHWYGYDLAILDLDGDKLSIGGRVEVGPEPRGVVLTKDGKTAYVAIGVANEVARVDLDRQQVTGRVAVGREPRSLALSADESTLLASNARGASVSVIALPAFEVVRSLPVNGVNLRQVAIDRAGKFGYVAHMQNRFFPTTKNNIDAGWVLGQRLTQVTVDGSDEYATLSLDPQGKAAGDAHGMAVSPDGRYLAVSLGGTHEVMLFRLDAKRLPWQFGRARDLISPELLNGDGRFRRVTTGGRPTELAFAPDGKTLYVANYLSDSIQAIDPDSAEVVKTISLGGPSEPSLARSGEILFHAAERSFNQWYSCNTCHSDGHTNRDTYDTMNDGWHDYSPSHKLSRKIVPTLRGVASTGPWTWHGWQTSLDEAMRESFTKSMQGDEPTEDDVKAIVAFITSLEHPRNPYRNADGSLTEQAKRGEQVFRSAKAACNTCHGGPEFTDGKVHNVGLEEPRDVHQGYNAPSLRGAYDRDPYLHDGRAKSLRDALTGDHSPDALNGLGELTEQELDDLIAYVRSL